jgi:hypothetical protein
MQVGLDLNPQAPPDVVYVIAILQQVPPEERLQSG